MSQPGFRLSTSKPSCCSLAGLAGGYSKSRLRARQCPGTSSASIFTLLPAPLKVIPDGCPHPSPPSAGQSVHLLPEPSSHILQGTTQWPAAGQVVPCPRPQHKVMSVAAGVKALGILPFSSCWDGACMWLLEGAQGAATPSNRALDTLFDGLSR